MSKLKVGGKRHQLEIIQIIKDNNRTIKFICKCDCGNNTSIQPCQFGRVKSCGCSRRKKKFKIGDKSNLLTIAEIGNYDGKRNNYLICRCDCGRFIKVLSNCFTRNKTCGICKLAVKGKN